MLVARGTALKVLPLLIAIWATLAVLGGVAHEAEGSGLSEELAEAGIHFCIAGVTAFAGLGLREAAARRAGVPTSSSVGLPRRESPPATYRDPPPPRVPRLRLIQIIRV